MAKLRLIFSKEGRAVYISHLDLMRTFQRVFMREGLILKHSQGFHPHPIISFALPLSVGQSSRCEILDFEVMSDTDGAGLAQRLNAGLPEGIKATDCYVPERPVKELAALRARVEFIYDAGVPAGAREGIGELFSQESVVIQKRTKRKALADVDIRPMLYSLRTEEEERALVLDVVVMAQNPGLNPALLGAAVETHLPQWKPDFVRVHRLAFLDAAGKEYR